MPSFNPLIKSVLVLYPLEPQDQLLKTLRSSIETVHFFPQRSGVEYSSSKPEPAQPSLEILSTIDAILCFHLTPTLYNGDLTQLCPRLKLIQAVGSGVTQITDSFFYESIPKEHELTFANSAGIHACTISEHVIMTVLMLFHRILNSERIIRREKRWAGPDELGNLFVTELRGKVFGILGYGHIARETARLASAFGAEIIVATRTGLPASIKGYHVPNTGDPSGSIPTEWYKTTDRSSLHRLLNRSDIVLNLLPSSSETKGIIGRDEFEQMKDSAIYVNTGRGDTNDQEALVEALKNGLETKDDELQGKTGELRIAGASLDVTNPEPLPAGHILLGGLDNVILTPHSSWMSKLNFVRAVDLFLINAERMSRGQGAINAIRGKGEE